MKIRRFCEMLGTVWMLASASAMADDFFGRFNGTPLSIPFSPSGMSVANSTPATHLTPALTEKQVETAKRVAPYAVLSNNVYRDSAHPSMALPKGWEQLGRPEENKQTGFYAETWGRKESGKIVELVMVFRGTNEGKDWKSSLPISGASSYGQYDDAREYAAKIVSNPAYRGAKIVATGHSLGGGLAQQVSYVHSLSGVQFVAFDSSPVAFSAGNAANLGVRISEMGEILDYVRKDKSDDVKFNFVSSPSPLANHDMYALAIGLSNAGAFNQNEFRTSTGIPASLAPNSRSNSIAIAFDSPELAITMAPRSDRVHQFFVDSANHDLTAFDVDVHMVFASAPLNTVDLLNARGTRSSATVLDKGGSTSAGDMYWGRWSNSGTAISITQGAYQQNSVGAALHYIYGAPVTNMPTSGIATYSPVGGTRPTNAHGAAGAFNGGLIQVNFATRAVNVMNLMFTSASGSQFLLGGSTTYGSNATFVGQTAGTCMGGNCSGGAASGWYSGAFAGNQAAGIGLAYAGRNAGTGTVMGVQAFKK